MSHYHLARRRLAPSKLICQQCLLTAPQIPSPLPPQLSLYSTSTQPSPVSPIPSPSAATTKPNPRWLTDIKSRLGKCILFGLSAAHIPQAGTIARLLAHEWPGLLAGAEGFLVPCGAPGIAAQKKYGMDPTWTEHVLWGEQDSMGHVNNVAYVRYAETSRIHYFRRLERAVPREYKREWEALRGNKGVGLILRGIKVEFLLPLGFPDRLMLGHRVERFEGEEGIGLRCVVLSQRWQRPAARMEEDVPTYDYGKGRKVELSAWAREVFKEAREEEERSKAYWLRRREEIEKQVEELERATVLSGKKEDMGGKT